jgi:hypothetical protein
MRIENCKQNKKIWNAEFINEYSRKKNILFIRDEVYGKREFEMNDGKGTSYPHVMSPSY